MADESIRPEAQDYLRQLVNEGLEHYAEEALDPEDNNFVTSLFSLPNLHLYHEAQDQLHIRFHQQLEDYAVEASADDSEEWCLKDLKPPISCACSMATSSLGKDPTVYSFPRFMELPLEIREQIYDLVLGRQVIHITKKICRLRKGGAEHDILSAKPFVPIICVAGVSDIDLYQAFKETIAAIRKRAGPSKIDDIHADCSYALCNEGRLMKLDLLYVSKKVQLEACKVLGWTNVLAFDQPRYLRQWLKEVPTGTSLRNVHLNMHLTKPAAGPWSDITVWKKVIVDILVKQFLSLTELHLLLGMRGFSTCWHMAHAAQISDMVLPVRDVQQLQIFTVVILELPQQVPHGPVWLAGNHDEHCTTGRPAESYWKRQELTRVWAEELRALVLDKGRLTC